MHTANSTKVVFCLIQHKIQGSEVSPAGLLLLTHWSRDVGWGERIGWWLGGVGGGGRQTHWHLVDADWGAAFTPIWLQALRQCQQRADMETDEEGEGGGALGNPSPFIIRKHTHVQQQVSSCGWLWGLRDRQRGGQRQSRALTGSHQPKVFLDVMQKHCWSSFSVWCHLQYKQL